MAAPARGDESARALVAALARAAGCGRGAERRAWEVLLDLRADDPRAGLRRSSVGEASLRLRLRGLGARARALDTLAGELASGRRARHADSARAAGGSAVLSERGAHAAIATLLALSDVGGVTPSRVEDARALALAARVCARGEEGRAAEPSAARDKGVLAAALDDAPRGCGVELALRTAEQDPDTTLAALPSLPSSPDIDPIDVNARGARDALDALALCAATPGAGMAFLRAAAGPGEQSAGDKKKLSPLDAQVRSEQFVFLRGESFVTRQLFDTEAETRGGGAARAASEHSADECAGAATGAAAPADALDESTSDGGCEAIALLSAASAADALPVREPRAAVTWEERAAVISGGASFAPVLNTDEPAPAPSALFGRMRLGAAEGMESAHVRRGVTDGLAGVHNASSLLAVPLAQAHTSASTSMSASASRSLLGDAAVASARRRALESAAAAATAAPALASRALAVALAAELRALDTALACLPAASGTHIGADQPLSMLQTSLHTEGARAHLRSLHVLMCSSGSGEAPPVASCFGSSASLIDALHARASRATPDFAPTARRLLGAALRPYAAMLREWLATGSCEDPHDEFFIEQACGDAGEQARLHLEGARRPPAFLRGVAGLALAAGLQVRVLAAFAPTRPLAERLGDLAGASANASLPLDADEPTLLASRTVLGAAAAARSAMCERFFVGRRARRTALASTEAAALSAHRAAVLRAVRAGERRAQLRAAAARAARRGDVAAVASIATLSLENSRAAADALREARGLSLRTTGAEGFGTAGDAAAVRARDDLAASDTPSVQQAVASASRLMMESHEAWMRALDAAEARAEWRRLRYEAAGARLKRGLQARGGSDGRGAGDLDAEAERAAEDAILALGDDDFVTLTRGSTGPDETHLRVAADFRANDVAVVGGDGNETAHSVVNTGQDETAELDALAGAEEEALHSHTAEVVRQMAPSAAPPRVSDAPLAPLEAALGASIVAEAHLWHASASECVLRLLMDEQRLAAHLGAIRLVALMRAGDAAHELTTSLEARCCGADATGRPTPGEAELANMLEAAMRGSSVDQGSAEEVHRAHALSRPGAHMDGRTEALAQAEGDLAMARCSIGWVGGRAPAIVDRSSLHAFDALRFDYDTRSNGGDGGEGASACGALSTVISQEAIEVYSELMRFQIAAARAQAATDATFSELSAAERFLAARERTAARRLRGAPITEREAAERAARALRGRLHRVQRYRHEAAHFVRAFREHVGMQLAGVCWSELMAALSRARTLGCVVKAHREYLEEAKVRCLLADDQAAAREAVESVLQGAISLHRLCDAAARQAERLAGDAGAGAGAATMAALADAGEYAAICEAHARFTDSAEFLYALLEQVASRQRERGGEVQDGGAGAGGLMLRLDYNQWVTRTALGHAVSDGCQDGGAAASTHVGAQAAAGGAGASAHFFTPMPAPAARNNFSR